MKKLQEKKENEKIEDTFAIVIGRYIIEKSWMRFLNFIMFCFIYLVDACNTSNYLNLITYE